MKAIAFEKSIPRFVAMKLLGTRRSGRLATGSWNVFSPAALRDVPEQPLPTEEWVRVAPRLSGICGSDLSVICAKGSPYFAPLTSTPFVFGHEVVGVVTELGGRVAACESSDGLPALSVGDRVFLEPALGCRVRGITPPCAACSRGQNALCINVTRGDISAGIQTGYCRDTGGAWADSFVAHRTQLFPVPAQVHDEAAVLAEPFSCALHGVLRVALSNDQTLFVVGCGAIGLLTVAAIRAIGCTARIVAVAKYSHQRQHAMDLGANVIVAPPRHDGGRRGRYDQWAGALDAELYYPELGKPTVLGGANVTFDCIGSSTSIDDSIRFTASGGDVVLIGMPGIPSNVDWTSIWYKELSLHAAYAYGVENARGAVAQHLAGRHTCDIAIDLLETWGDRLARLVSQPYRLHEHRHALRSALFTARSGVVKTLFRISE